jgi:hypothetical protein
MSTDAAQDIVDLAFSSNPDEPGYYLLGLAVGILQQQGRELEAIQRGVRLAFDTSFADARAFAQALDRDKGRTS